MAPVLDIIIINWNSGTQLRRCLDSVASAEVRGLALGRVVVVDNASSDHSADGLEDLPLPLVCIRNATNRGFAAACNQGAAGSWASHLLFLNPDTVLASDSLVVPLAFMEQPANRTVGIAGVQLRDENGVVARSCARFLTPGMIIRGVFGLDRVLASRFPDHFMTDWDYRETREVDHVTGAFFLVRREVFQSLEGFDERFFIYLEDLDFSLRARRAGWHTYYLATASAYHRGGGTSEQIKARRIYYSLRSRILYAYKHFGWPTATALTLATTVLEFVTRLGRAIARRSLTEARDTVHAYGLLWRALPTITRHAG
ncbi:MAG TPA: glycosyltransferase family 2 protein [Gemmatimonadales bacterium]|nr:glycosyltransferase family 2 protein [Gemmatimonadales bacterium]